MRMSNRNFEYAPINLYSLWINKKFPFFYSLVSPFSIFKMLTLYIYKIRNVKSKHPLGNGSSYACIIPNILSKAMGEDVSTSGPLGHAAIPIPNGSAAILPELFKNS